jgi:coupling of ubiquitin conjugation to ER degradation protein 1
MYICSNYGSQVETVRAMFPHIPSAAIVASLQTTGSVEITIEQVLRDGTLPMVSRKI